MTTTARERELRAAYGHEALRSFWQAARKRLENAGSEPAKSFTWEPQSAEEREKVEITLGLVLNLPAGPISMRIDQIEAALRRHRLQPRLREILEALDGRPLRDRPAARKAYKQGWERFDEMAQAEVSNEPILQIWYDRLRQEGYFKRCSDGDFNQAETFLKQSLGIIRALGEITSPIGKMLRELAAEQCEGDSHTLDAGQPLRTLVLRAAAHITGLDQWHNAETQRKIWRAVGVIDDTVNSMVFVLNLPGDSDSMLGRVLQRQARCGTVRTVNLQELETSTLRFDRSMVGPIVYVCENPTIIESAARHFGVNTYPMVCINGQPRCAAHRILELLSEAGISLLYHGDFDWWGIQIGKVMIERHGAIPWRFSADDYVPGSRPLTGKPTSACWDSNIQMVLEKGGRAMDEEAVLTILRSDLQRFPDTQEGAPTSEAAMW